jgi:hypothetical protein
MLHMQVEAVVLSPEGGSKVGFAPRSEEGFVSEARALAKARIPSGHKVSLAERSGSPPASDLGAACGSIQIQTWIGSDLDPILFWQAVPGPPNLPPQVSFQYYTHKPADYPMPYGTLEKNGVPFQALFKEENKFATFLVRQAPP